MQNIVKVLSHFSVTITAGFYIYHILQLSAKIET